MMLVPAITNLAHVHASPSMELDGVGTKGSNSGCSAFCMRSQLLTTSMGDDVIIVTLECGEGPSSGHPCDGIAITDDTGLTFTKRLSFPASGDSGTLWEFYAVAASPLKSDNITVAADFCCRGGGMLVLGIHGANTSMVFDPNRSIPASNSYTRGDCIVGSGTCSASIQTDTVDFVIGTTAIDDAPPCGDGYPNGNVPGFTNIGSGPNSNFEVDYAITTTPQTNVEYACSGTDVSGIVLDAVSSGNGLQSHAPILISGNDGFTTDNGVTGGTGTSDDPYVISGWTISAENFGIQISDTTAYFTITNVAISCDPTNASCWGIMLSSIENGVVQNSHLSGPKGIGIHNSDNFQVTENNLSPGETGIGLWDSSSFDVSNNVVYGGGDDTVFLWNVTNFDLSGNSIHSGEVVIFLGFASSFDISNNSLEGGTFAINGDHVSDASIVGNTGGAEDGIVLSNFSGLLISQNSIVGHVSIGVQHCVDSTFEVQNPWPMSHQNAQHTGLSPFPGPTAPVLKWAFQTSGQDEAAPAIGNGIIYVGSTDGNLYALNLQGQLIWKLQTPSAIRTTPAIGSDGTIYLASSIQNSSGRPEGILHAISPAGRTIWNVTLANFQGYDSLSSPTIGSDGTIYTSDVGFRTLAVNPDGTLRWVLQTGGEVFDSPAVGQDGTLYVATDDDNPSPTVVCGQCVAALNPDGTVKWSLRPGGGFGFPAVGSDGTVYVDGVAVSSNGTLEWQGRPFVSPSIGTDGTIYGTGNQGLFAINQDGSTRWRFPTETEGGSGNLCCSYDVVQESSVAIGSNGILYFGDWFDHYCSCAPEPSGYGNATLYAVNPDGTQAWNFVIQPTIACSTFPCPTLSLSDPAIGSDGTLYIGSGY